MQKQTIKNRRDLNMVVQIEEVEKPKGLAFVMHGLGGWKEQPHVETFASAFKEKSYSVVRFDTTNSYNESEGSYENATLTNYYEDLEDVVAWAKEQPWFQKPFVLCGHSLGGISTALYSERFPEEVKAVAPISPVVSGELSAQTEKKKNILDDWKKTGWAEWKSESVPGRIKRLPWSHMEDRLKYDLFPLAHNLTMPVLIIVGEEDQSTPPEHQKLLFEKLPGPKELHVIKGAPHTFREQKHLDEIKEIMLNWINKLN